jgi:hypothetical protein
MPNFPPLVWVSESKILNMDHISQIVFLNAGTLRLYEAGPAYAKYQREERDYTDLSGDEAQIFLAWLQTHADRHYWRCRKQLETERAGGGGVPVPPAPESTEEPEDLPF